MQGGTSEPTADLEERSVTDSLRSSESESSGSDASSGRSDKEKENEKFLARMLKWDQNGTVIWSGSERRQNRPKNLYFQWLFIVKVAFLFYAHNHRSPSQ